MTGKFFLLISGDGPAREYEIRPGRQSVGRSRERDIRLEDHKVSRSHAEISYKRGRLFIRDLGSLNGTFVGSARVTKSPFELAVGDKVRLGDTTLEVWDRPPNVAAIKADTTTDSSQEQPSTQEAPVSPAKPQVFFAVPVWDKNRRELRAGSMVVKQFKEPAANQELILIAFQEQGWPGRIDDPLPPVSGIDPKQRLHDAIKRLNQNQKHGLIHFFGDGTGQGVCWEFVEDANEASL